MNLPELPQTNSRRELHKALIRLRMEMHRQEIRHESRDLLSPALRMRAMTKNWQESLGIKHAPLWGVGAVVLLGFLTGKGTRNGAIGSLTKLVRLGSSLIPLIRLVMQRSAQKD